MTYTLTAGKNTITLNTVSGDISGSTYQMKEIIKGDLKAKWDAARKVWHSDNLEATVIEYEGYLTRVYGLCKVTPAATTSVSSVYNGLCPKCGTYCYGDCTAS